MAPQSSDSQGATAEPSQSNTDMASNSEKVVTAGDIHATDKREGDVVSTGSLKNESVKGRAQILGATAEEILEAEEHARTMDLDEARKVRRINGGP